MNKIKRLISLVLCLCFVLSCAVIPVSVSAAGVATVAGVEYATLEDAFAAAGTGDTVLLTADVLLGAPITVTKNIILSADSAFTVTRADISAPAFTVAAGGTLTVAGPVTFDGGPQASTSAFVCVEGGTLNVRDGVTFTSCYSSAMGGAVRVNSGVCVLAGGSFSGNSAESGAAVYVGSSASGLRIAGGVSFGDGDSIYLASGKYIEITGTLTGSGTIPVQAANAAVGSRIALIGGPSVTLSDEQIARFSIETENGTRSAVLDDDEIVVGTATSSSVAAKIGDKEFESLQDAIASVTQGSKATIELYADAEISSEIIIKGVDITIVGADSFTISRASNHKVGYLFSVSSGASLTIGKSVTLSGASISATMSAIYCGGSVTVESGATVTAHKNVNPNLFYQGTVFVPEGGSFTLNGGRITSNSNTAGAVMVYGGTFTMNSGEISGNTAENGGGVYVRSGSFNMNGGTISGNTAIANGGAVYSAGTLKLAGKASIPGGAGSANDIYLAGGRSISVDSGWNPGASVAAITPSDTGEGTKLVFFATAAEAKPEYFVLTGDLSTKVKLRAKDNYIYIGPLTDEKYVAYIGQTPYTTLNDAINAVPADNTVVTVTVVDDVVLTGTVIVPEGKNIVLTTGVDPTDTENPDYTARTIKRDAIFDGAFFAIAEKARVQITPALGKQLVIDGAGTLAANSAFVVQGTLEIHDGTVIRANNVKKNENLTAEDPIFGQGGAVIVGSNGNFNMLGGSLEGNYAARGGAVFVNDGIFNFYGGTIKGNSALFGGAVMIINYSTTDNVTVVEPAEGTTAPVAVKHGYMTMTGGSITENNAVSNPGLKYANGQGGGIYVGNAATIEATGGTVTKNKAGTGAGIYLGTLRSKGEKALRIPVMLISGAFATATDDDVHLALVNESVVTVTGALTGIHAKSPMTITLPNLLAQNTALVEYKVATYSPEQNALAAEGAVNTGAFKLTGETDTYYNIKQSTANKAVLLNTLEAEAYLTYLTGRHYNGIPAYEEKVEKDEEGKEVTTKTALTYEPVTITPDGTISASFEMSYYVNLYTNMHTQLVGALPVGTKITLVDTSVAEKPAYYYYEVTGKEAVRKVENAEEIKEGDPVPLKIYEIPLEDFFVMGQEKVRYGEVDKEENPSAEKTAIATEHFTFVIDFSEAEIDENTLFEGAYTLAWEHNYPGETEGSYHNISENFAVVEYTVSDESESVVTIAVEDEDIVVEYKLGPASRCIETGRGVILLETANDNFPEGTVATVNNTDYPVLTDSGRIAITLPISKSGELETEGKVKIRLSNYYGDAVLETTVRAVICTSYDGRHVTVGAENDAESEGVTYALEAKDSYSISVTGADGTKPAYEYENPAKAESLLMTVKALRNADNAESVTLTLQDAKNDYEEVPLSVLFVGYDDAASEGITLPVGSCTMKIRENAADGEYRLVFTIGNKSEYVKIKIGK